MGLSFVDTNVFVYAVGRPHPLREQAQALLRERLEHDRPMATSAEVLQELMHVYLPVGRMETLDAALRLASDLTTIWPIEASDVLAARDLAVGQPGLGRARPAAPRALPSFRSSRAALLRPSARGSVRRRPLAATSDGSGDQSSDASARANGPGPLEGSRLALGDGSLRLRFRSPSASATR